jgi:sugar O-acyltransferase (sialic acid O-acetyltransferase NeuD family)
MKKAIVGYGGHAKEVMAQMGIRLTCFVDDEYVVDGTKPLSEFDPNEFALMIAIADSKSRCDITNRLPKETKYFTWVHPTSLIMDNNIEIGEGSFIGAYSILTTNIKIGKHAILNRGNHIGHDSKIGDYFSAMPGAIVSGNVTIYDSVYLGNNATIKEKLSIHGQSIIGSNAAVVKSISSPGTYVGVPVKKLEK